MVEVDAFAGDVVAALLVASGHGVDFVPEGGLVDFELFEDRLLHVARNECFVEVPDDGDFVLCEIGLGHGGKE